jgi:hypothetical protein
MPPGENMKIFRTIAVLATIVLAALLTGCGDGGGDTASEASVDYMTLAADRSAALADGSDGINFTATVKDLAGNPLSGRDVSFSVSESASSPTVVRTDASGQSTFTLKRTPQELATYGESLYVDARCADRGASVTARFLSGPIIDLFDEGGGTYTVTVKGLSNISRIEIQLGFNTDALSDPQVEWGNIGSSSAMSAEIPRPGTIMLSFDTTAPFSGSGKLAILRFKELGPSSKKIVSLGAALTDSSGNYLGPKLVMPRLTTTTTPLRGT